MTTVTKLHADLIDAYVAHLQLRRRSPRTVETYAGILRHAHRDLPHGLVTATTGEISMWLATCRAPRTQSLYTVAIRNFFAWATSSGELDWDPTTTIPRPHVGRALPRVPHDDDVRVILTRISEPYRLWSRVAALAGARCIEIARLDRRDITPERIRLWGQGNKERLVPTHPALWRTVAGLPPGRITDCDERSISRRTWHAYRRELGIETSIHKLRAWFATTALRATGNLAAVQDLLGHANPATTRRYAVPSEDQMRDAVLQLPDLTADEDDETP